MGAKYLIRLDDASPYMESKQWDRIEILLDRYGIKPLVGIIPAKADGGAIKNDNHEDFWEKAHHWVEKGWSLALHGYDHSCISSQGLKGLNPMWKRSEFSGISLEAQKKKIRDGLRVFKSHRLSPNYFFAPCHTFDQNTLNALKEESEIRIISDTIALKPYRKGEFVFIPQILGHCVSMPIPGIYTFCIHPNTITEHALEKLSDFLNTHSREFISFSEIDVSAVSGERLIDRCIRGLFFLLRMLRGLK